MLEFFLLLISSASAEDLLITKPLRDRTYNLFDSIELECGIQGAQEFTWEKDDTFLEKEDVASIDYDYVSQQNQPKRVN